MRWFDPGVLIDQELELVLPDEPLIDDVLFACRHPLTIRHAAREAATTRQQLLDFLKFAPAGRDPGDVARQRAQGYAFWMRLQPQFDLPVKIAGGVSLRVAETADVQMYFGNFGYHVYPPARGRRIAERACRLLLPLARAHGLRELWITCNPDNWPSRRTAERLGAQFVDVVRLPRENVLYERGEREKCRYKLTL